EQGQEPGKQTKNVKRVLKQLGERPEPTTCHAAEGLKKEHTPRRNILDTGVQSGVARVMSIRWPLSPSCPEIWRQDPMLPGHEACGASSPCRSLPRASAHACQATRGGASRSTRRSTKSSPRRTCSRWGTSPQGEPRPGKGDGQARPGHRQETRESGEVFQRQERVRGRFEPPRPSHPAAHKANLLAPGERGWPQRLDETEVGGCRGAVPAPLGYDDTLPLARRARREPCL